MAIKIVAGSLVELLATISFVGYTFAWFWAIVIYREFFTDKKCRQWKSDTPRRQAYVSGEQRTLSFATWFVVNLVTATLLSIFFAEVYESEDDVDSAPIILALLVLQQVFMMLWLLMQSVWCQSPTRWPFIWIMLTFATAIVETALVFTTLHGEHWYHYLVLTLFIAPLMAAFASNGVVTYRNTLHSVQLSRPSVLARSSAPYQSGVDFTPGDD